MKLNMSRGNFVSSKNCPNHKYLVVYLVFTSDNQHVNNITYKIRAEDFRGLEGLTWKYWTMSSRLLECFFELRNSEARCFSCLAFMVGDIDG